MRKLKVCLAGVGGISRSHILAWENMENAQLTALCDIRKERLEQYPDKHHYLDFEKMLEREKPDILDICLPTYLHVDYAVRAMERGIHVLCEKPVALKETEADRVYEAADKNQVCFMVAQVLRFWPEYVFLKEMYDTQKYGKLLAGSMTRLAGMPKWNWDNWMKDESRSGQVPFDLHIHDLDFMVYAFGAPEKQEVHRVKRPEQDYIQAVYQFHDFFISAQAAWLAVPWSFCAGFRFQFERAVLSYEESQCILYENNGKVTNLSGQGSMDTDGSGIPQSNAYANEIRYFADCVLSGHFPDRIRKEELKTVIRILRSM